MKFVRFLLVISALLFISVRLINSCPFCVGVLERDTPPLFSDEYDVYVATHTHHAHAQPLAPQPNTAQPITTAENKS
jgi:hypothetical protein